MVTVETGPAKRITKLAGPTDIYDVLEFVRENGSGAASSNWLELDLREFEKKPSQRSAPHWIEILSNELLGEFAERKLVIRPPSTMRGRRSLDRSGLSFAIAQRNRTSTDVQSHGGKFEGWPLADWKREWCPGDSLFRRKLMRDRDEPDELIQGEFVTFLNPHLHASSLKLGVELVDYQVRPWVERLLGQSRGSDEESDTVVTSLIEDITVITYQLVENLRYAFPTKRFRREHILAPARKSYVQLYTTSGGGSESYDRLHLVVADTGIGIVGSLKPKLRYTHEGRVLDSQSIIDRLLHRSLPPYGRAAGGGYRKIIDAVCGSAGQLLLTTGSTRLDRTGEVFRASLSCRRESSPTVTIERDANLHFIGTTVHAIVPIRRAHPEAPVHRSL